MYVVAMLLTLMGLVGVGVGGISILVPLRFLGVRSRLMGVAVAIVGMILIVGAPGFSPKLKAEIAQSEKKRQVDAARQAANAPAPKPTFTSSGGCRTRPNGDMDCDSSASLNAGWLKSESRSTMRCRTHPGTGEHTCTMESSAD